MSSVTITEEKWRTVEREANLTLDNVTLRFSMLIPFVVAPFAINMLTMVIKFFAGPCGSG